MVIWEWIFQDCIKIFFSPHNCTEHINFERIYMSAVQVCGFLCANMQHDMDKIEKQEENNGTDVYEREKNTAARIINGTANGTVHGGKFFVQYCRQLFCGTVQ